MRKRNPDFDADNYLTKHPIPRVQPWGSIFIKIDMAKCLSCSKKHLKTNAVAPSCLIEKPLMTERGLLAVKTSASNSFEMTQEKSVSPLDEMHQN